MMSDRTFKSTSAAASSTCYHQSTVPADYASLSSHSVLSRFPSGTVRVSPTDFPLRHFGHGPIFHSTYRLALQLREKARHDNRALLDRHLLACQLLDVPAVKPGVREYPFRLKPPSVRESTRVALASFAFLLPKALSGFHARLVARCAVRCRGCLFVRSHAPPRVVGALRCVGLRLDPCREGLRNSP